MNSNRLTLVTNAVIALATLLAVYYGAGAVNEYKKANRAEARAQLYGAERTISQLEVQDPVLLRIYANASAAADADTYIAQHMAISANNDPSKPFEPLSRIKHAKDLYNFIWGADTFSHPNCADLRKLYLHAELYVYHLHNCLDLTDEGFITEKEWETWRHLIVEIGPHPITLAAIYSAEQNKYFSQSFAESVQQSFSTNPLEKAVIMKFYPEILDPTWPKKFPEF